MGIPSCTPCASPASPYAGPGGHGYLEIALDSTLHEEDTGSALVPVNDVSLPIGEELADITAPLHTCLLEVYGVDVSGGYLADAFYQIAEARVAGAALRGLFPQKILDLPEAYRVLLAGGAALRRARVHNGGISRPKTIDKLD